MNRTLFTRNYVPIIFSVLLNCASFIGEMKNGTNPPPDGIVLETFSNGRIKKMLLNKDWIGPRRQLCATGTIMEYFENGAVKKYVLAENWLLPDSFIAKEGTTVEHFNDGKIMLYILAEDRPNDLDATLKGGTPVYYFRNGAPKQFTLAKNWVLKWGQVLMANTDVEYFDDGSFKQYTLAEDWVCSIANYFKPGTVRLSSHWLADAIFKKGTAVKYYESGYIKEFTLASDWRAVCGAVLMGGFAVECYDNNKLKQFTIANNWRMADGSVFNAGNVLQISENGTIHEFSVYNEMDAVNGELNYGLTGARRYNNWENNTSLLTVPSDNEKKIDTGQNHTSLSPTKTLQEQERTLARGIHIVLSKDIEVVKRIKSEQKELWKYHNEDFYHHFSDSKELDDGLRKHVDSIKNDSTSDLFQWNGYYVIVQKYTKK